MDRKLIELFTPIVKMKSLILTLAILSTGLTSSCQSDMQSEDTTSKSGNVSNASANPKRNLNLSVLLDLSDRIDTNKYPDPTMHFFRRDIGNLENIAIAFAKHVKKKKIVILNEHLKTYVEPLPSEGKVLKSLNALEVEISRSSSKDDVINIEKNYANYSANLYKQAIEDGVYPGSDTYGFMQQKAVDYCIREGSLNKLIIITDGYLYYKNRNIVDSNRVTQIDQKTLNNRGYNNPDWKSMVQNDNFGFYVPEGINLDQLEIMVLGIHSKSSNPFEVEVLSFLWQDWLESMGAKKVVIQIDDLPLNLQRQIEKFVLDI